MLSISATGLAWIRSSLIQARTTSPSSASLPSLTACPSWTTGRGMSAIASTAPSLLCSHHICCRIAAQLMYSSRCCAARCRYTSKKRLPSTTTLMFCATGRQWTYSAIRPKILRTSAIVRTQNCACPAELSTPPSATGMRPFFPRSHISSRAIRCCTKTLRVLSQTQQCIKPMPTSILDSVFQLAARPVSR